ncbi:MAG: hypothetical protein ACLP0J_18445 [Solirubrobacteraceae bacterium]
MRSIDEMMVAAPPASVAELLAVMVEASREDSEDGLCATRLLAEAAAQQYQDEREAFANRLENTVAQDLATIRMYASVLTGGGTVPADALLASCATMHDQLSVELSDLRRG